jgi:hypothetical protein
VNHDKSPLEQAVDLAIFGPLGLALAAKDALPDWVDLGRRRVVHRIEVARIVGEHASRYGQKVVTETLVDLGILPGPPPPPPNRPAAAPPAARETTEVRPDLPAPATNGTGPAATGDVLGSNELAIPGYDSLSAFQVVQRLAGLAPDELEAVRGYEAAGRGRRTILTKISQLQLGRT